jgi:hypothetical protein
LAASAALSSAEADGSSSQYFIALRTPQVDQTPRYVTATTAPSDGQSSPFAACDGNTYYLSSEDAAAVSAALASEATVQLQSGPQGTAPENSSVLCLVQASP